MIKIAADSTCDLSRELLERYEVRIIPLHILLGEEEYEDGVALNPDIIFQWSDEHKETPKTSAVSIDTAREAFQSLLGEDEGNEIICFTISSEMSSTANVMKMAAAELDAEEQIHVIDSRNLSTGIGLLVIEAASMAKEGKQAEEILDKIHQLIPQVRASFVVDGLEYLHRGGRCGGLTAMVGSTLRLHPQIVVEDGKMHSSRNIEAR